MVHHEISQDAMKELNEANKPTLIKVKRNGLVCMSYLGIIAMDIYQLSFSQASKPFFINLILVATLLFCVAIVVWLLINPNYILLQNDKIVIYHDLFEKELFDCNQVKEIKIKSGPFEKSYFIRENRFSIEFRYFYVNDKDLKKLIEHLKVNVS